MLYSKKFQMIPSQKSILPKLLYEPCNYVGKLWKLELLEGFLASTLVV